MGYRRSSKKSLVSIFSLYILVPKYVWFPLFIFSINCNTRAKTRRGNASSLQIRERKQHDNTKKKYLTIWKYSFFFIATETKQKPFIPFLFCTNNILFLSFSTPTGPVFALLLLLLLLLRHFSHVQLCETP